MNRAFCDAYCSGRSTEEGVYDANDVYGMISCGRLVYQEKELRWIVSIIGREALNGRYFECS